MAESTRRRKRPVPPSTQAMSYPRKRAVAACQLCRRRKTKCDNVRPTCGFCENIGASCVYQAPETDYSSFDPAALALLERMDYMISLVEKNKLGPPENSNVPATSDYSQSSAVWPWTANAESQEIPSRCNISCRILEWPIFEEIQYDRTGDTLFTGQANASQQKNPRSRGIVEDHIPSYVDRFLTNVHTKNPVVDHTLLSKYVRDIAENGLSWDGPTSVTLMACALGIVSQPFQQIPVTQLDSVKADLPLAEVYYTAARKRIGLLDTTSLVYIQTTFLSGVYEMYTLRPLAAWHSFHTACSSMQLYFKTRYPGLESSETQNLEERLRWSCFKSEREIRTEINLTPLKASNRDLAEEYPMPPHEAREGEAPTVFPLEESWYYYLTDISQRRILDRILNSFYAQESDQQWLQTSSDDMARTALELDRQLATIDANLPPWLHYSREELGDRELPYFIHRRLLHMQECLFKPFLFRVVHSDQTQPQVVFDLAQRCVEACRMNILETAIQHRHHGSWFVARGAFRCAMALIAAAQSGILAMPNDWFACVETALTVIEFWGQEAADLQPLGQILRTVYSYTRVPNG
ncbi:hypothetical protein N7510_006467 [Penicillium lagena]|uniref:uncharacterized protein n=1 Tax=Penicillium lagena TaxID=94218 RepID=UPI002540A38D|nr:uncharacterized protein N7510_006467 [Penicillium lagena]KAJ5613273.1 hypothetical protein N7510_006467 [Penicillium lagena]